MKTTKPVISFVIPLYNKQAYIAETIQSLRRQTEANIEIVVVNDGSTDESGGIVDYIAKQEPRLRVIHQDNAGRSVARNVGNAAAQANIIAVNDADDVSDCNRAVELLGLFSKNKKADITYSSFVVGDEWGNPSKMIDAVDIDIESLKRTGYTGIGHSTMAYRKQVSMENKYRSGAYSKLGIDDWAFQVDCLHGGRLFVPIAKPLVLYRMLASGTEATRNADDVRRAKNKLMSQYFGVTL